MVKFSNKTKGKPSKRKKFKVKYKIERKVKQHNKRVKSRLVNQKTFCGLKWRKASFLAKFAS